MYSDVERKELQQANNAIRTDIHKKLTLKQKEKHDLVQQSQQFKATKENMAETHKMYLEIQKERLRFLKLDYMHKEPDDVEDMVAALYNHFSIIKKTSYKARTRDNG